ncbi:hypothetical protein [Isoptericola sp. NPDC055881]
MHLVSRTPASLRPPGAMLAAGRRAGLATSIAVSLCVVAGCANSVDDPGPQSTRETVLDVPDAVAPIIDERGGTVQPGSMRLFVDEYHRDKLDFIVRAATTDCLRRQGYTGPVDRVRVPDPLYGSAVVLPPWLETQAARFGFLPPQPLADLVANGVEIRTSAQDRAEEIRELFRRSDRFYDDLDAAKETTRYKDAAAACKSDPAVARWSSLDIDEPAQGPWLEEFTADQTQAFADPAMTPIKADYDRCLSKHGLTAAAPDSVAYDDMFSVVGQSWEVIDEQQVALATQVARCKADTDAVPRMMEVWSRYEGATFLRYEQELTEALTFTEKTEAMIDEYLATHAE